MNGVTLTNRRIMDISIYGGLAHGNNRTKKEEYDRWMADPLLSKFLTTEFVHILGGVFKMISYIRYLNKEVLKELQLAVITREHKPLCPITSQFRAHIMVLGRMALS